MCSEIEKIIVSMKPTIGYYKPFQNRLKGLIYRVKTEINAGFHQLHFLSCVALSEFKINNWYLHFSALFCSTDVLILGICFVWWSSVTSLFCVSHWHCWYYSWRIVRIRWTDILEMTFRERAVIKAQQ